MDFEKELTHPDSQYAFNNKVGDQPKYFDGPLPSDKWFGFKYIIYNLDNKTVKMESYIDEVSNGDPDKIGNVNNWKKLGDMTDNGNWPAPIISDYKGQVDPKTVVTEGGGVAFVRNTGIAKVQYKYLSIREIVPPGEPVPQPAPQPAPEPVPVPVPQPAPQPVPVETGLEIYLHNTSSSNFVLEPNGKIYFSINKK